MSKPANLDAIWLQYGDDDPDDHEYRNEVTWCDATINSSDVKYLRATPVREAAPELLGACQAVINSAVTEDDACSFCRCDLDRHSSGCVMLVVGAVIAKAEGGDTGGEC